jgi:DNA-binding MarR family transcriptional regulator
MTAIDTDRANEAITPDLVFRLLGTAHTVTELLDGALGKLGLSAATLRLLTELVNAPQPLEPTELDRIMIGGGAEVGRLVDGIERDGLVRRTPQSGNGRAVRIVITARGRARQHAAAAHVDAVALQLNTALGGVDATAVERALSALR